MNKNQIFKKGSTTFFYSSLFFPKQVKEDVFTLYAYVRIIDDAVDQETPDIKLLDELWEQSQQAWEGKKVEHPLVADFIQLARRKNMKWDWIASFWWAMRQDLVKKFYKTFEELEKYMYGSAEVIGLMMASILDLPKEAQRAAQLQGKAMQLINFIRDVREDESLGRVYLPSLQTKHVSLRKTWKSIVEQQLKKYYETQHEAEKGYKYIPYRYLIPIKTAAQMYNWTAKQTSQDPGRVWKEKIKPNKTYVILSALKNAIRI